MPEPGSKKYDARRARLREDAERTGVPGKEANSRADEVLRREEGRRSQRTADRAGPRTDG